MLTNVLAWALKKLAQLIILRYRPGIIGVTGSVGKTSTKLAIAAVIGPSRRTRFSKGNLNNELGLPLAIVGDFSENEVKIVSRDTPEGEKKIGKSLFWIKVILTGVMNLIRRNNDYPEILVLEYGSDKPDDIKNLLEIARPNISVITAVGEIPVHVEFFAGPDELAKEKSRLIEQLPSAGFAILNHDDETVMDLKGRTRAHIFTFGFQKGSELRLTGFRNKVESGKPVGVSFRMEYGGGSVPVEINGVFGKVQAYASGAAAAVGLIFGINLIKIAESLKAYRPAPSRMELVAGAKQTTIINDSYNASPLSMHAALDVLRDLPAKRKIAVLGDMLELGEYSMEAHGRVGRIAAQVVDFLFTVGKGGKIIAEAAVKKGFSKKRIKSFDSADEAVDEVEKAIKKGDIILVKGSHAMELEKIAEAIKQM